MNNLTRLLMKNPSRGNYKYTYDFSGLNISRMYSLFKSNLATIDYCCKVAFNETIYYVFYDVNGEISLNSKVSLNTSIGITYLRDVIRSEDGKVLSIFCQITGHELVAVDNYVALLTEPYTNDLIYKNNKPVFKFNGFSGRYFDGLAIPEFNSGNDFSISSISSMEPTNTITTLFSSSTISSQKIALLMDSRSVGLNICQIRNTNNVLANNNYLTAQLGTDQRSLLQTYISEGDFSTYFQNALQETNAVTGSFLNDVFRLGASDPGSSNFKGDFQFLAVHNTSINETQRNSLNNKLDKYFKF